RDAGCPGGATCEADSGRCASVCSADESCPTGETCNVDAGRCGCAPGSHSCGAVCAVDDSVASCGGRCSPCAEPPNAFALCDGGVCDFVCRSGFHLCGGQCFSESSATACGASCSACPAPDGGALVAVCVDGGCSTA